MQVHLVLPGLLWPGKALHDTAFDLELPALSRLLGRGRVNWQPPLPVEAWLCREFRLPAEEPPAAALRLHGEGGDPGDDFWLCADPAHLKFEQGRLTLSGNKLEVGQAEIRQIVRAATPHLAEHVPGFAEFVAGSEGSHGYLRLRRSPQIMTTPFSAAVGRSIQLALPRGPEARAWLRLANELQMLLHALPLNRERETQGLPTLNTLWLWGSGVLPKPAPGNENRYQSILSDKALLRGIAAWAGTPMRRRPHRAEELPLAGNTLLFVDDLHLPAQELDANGWRNKLVEIDHDWLSPLQAALASGGMESLRLTALGEEACLDVHLKRSDLFKFWRRPVALHQVTPPLTPTPP
jgi:hypothetical protein